MKTITNLSLPLKAFSVDYQRKKKTITNVGHESAYFMVVMSWTNSEYNSIKKKA